MRAAIEVAHARGLAGRATCSAPACAFDLHVRVGAGAYICGEETSMLESLEGKRGRGAGQAAAAGASRASSAAPTVVNNVLTLAAVPTILADGGAGVPRRSASGARAAPRCSSSPATSPAAASSRPPSGSRCASWSRTTAAAPAAGGPSARSRSAARSAPTCRQSRLDLPMDYEAFAASGAMVGPRRRRGVRRHRRHGRAGPVRDGVLRRGVLRQVHPVPDRLGARGRGDRPDRRADDGTRREADLVLLEDLCDTDGRRARCARWAG